MFTTEQFKQAFGTAQARATAKAREFEAEARKILEALGDRAQAELKVLISQTKGGTRAQIVQVGSEIEKLGRKLQDLARSAEPAKEPSPNGDAATSGVQPPVN